MKGSRVGERELETMLRSVADGWPQLEANRLRHMAAVATRVAQRSDLPNSATTQRTRRVAFRWVRPRVGIALSAAAAFIALAIVAATVLVRSTPAAAGIRFSTQGGYIVATVTDPFASADQLRQAFTEQGLDIDLKLVPASPSLVGTVVATEQDSGSGIQALQGGTCITGGGSCPVGLRIPLHYHGHAEITLARPAKPGENYVASADAFAPGEPLRCSGLSGARVATAAKTITSRGLSAVWRPYRDSGNTRLDPVAVGHEFVIDIDSIAPNQVMVWVSPTPLHDLGYPALERYLRLLNSGC